MNMMAILLVLPVHIEAREVAEPAAITLYWLSLTWLEGCCAITRIQLGMIP